MGISFVKPAAVKRVAKRKPTKAVAPVVSLDQSGILRICNLMAVLSLSRASIYVRIGDGRLPKPDGDDGRPWWRTESVKTFLDTRYKAGAGGAQ